MPGSLIIPSMMSVCHELAYAGCSCTKYRPAFACSRYSSTQNSRCCRARFNSPATVTGHRILLLIRCHVENAVHIGDPTSSMGFSSASFFLARSRMTTSSKSHGRPSVSTVVNSSANPGITFSSGSSFDAAVTLGGE